MRRRRLLRSGAIRGAGTLAGCNELRGEGDEANAAFEQCDASNLRNLEPGRIRSMSAGGFR